MSRYRQSYRARIADQIMLPGSGRDLCAQTDTRRHLSTGVGVRIYHSAVRLKLYLAVGIAAGVAAYVLGVGPVWSLAVALLAPAVLSAAPPFLRGTLVGLRTARDTAAEMSGMEFEDYVARIARSCGVPVIMTSITGDWGVDLIVGKRPNRLAIQCKRQARPVGAAAVQEVVAGAPMQDCTKTMVVTNHEFTRAARKLADYTAANSSAARNCRGCGRSSAASLSFRGRRHPS
jgi:restriction system protein